MLGLSLGLGGSRGVVSDGSALDLNFASSVPGTVTFTRASTATYVNSSGLIASAAIDAPRIDYNPSTLVTRGLLIEPAATNLCLYSDDFTNAAWTASNCTTAKTATGPDGVSNSASTLTATAGNATVLQAITSASASRLTSCWIKRRTGTGVVEMTQDNGTAWAAVTVTASWTRVSIAAATAANPTVGLRIVTSGDAIDVALFQHETGTAISSAIPTTSATVTRAADVASMTGTNFSDWYNATEGTVVVEAETLVSGGRLFSISAGANTDRIYSRASTASHIVSQVGGVVQADIDAGTFSTSAVAKLAAAYKANDFAACIDGGAVATDVSGTLPTVNKINIGSAYNGASQLNGHIRRLRYWNTRLADATMQELTA